MRLARKIVWQLPAVRDGVAKKYDSAFARWRERGVGLPIACQLPEIVCVDGNLRRPVLIQPGEARGRYRRSGLLWARAGRERRIANSDCDRVRMIGCRLMFSSEKQDSLA
jgi:hypothetical protein